MSGETVDADFTEEGSAAAAWKVSDLPDPMVLVRLVELLRPFPAALRLRAIRGALAFLGDEPLLMEGLPDGGRVGVQTAIASTTHVLGVEGPFSRRVEIWFSQNALQAESLDSIFHRSATGWDVIVHNLPATTTRERVQQCYLLCGLVNFLSSGEPKLADDDARALCRMLGCYDAANHATYVKAIGNLITGNKNSGFELTQPGLRAGAELVKKMAHS